VEERAWERFEATRRVSASKAERQLRQRLRVFLKAPGLLEGESDSHDSEHSEQ
jgi:hypothetical protein